MELHEFVKETLVQIVKGITEAQEHEVIQKNNASIVPHGVSSYDKKSANRDIAFDVIVSTNTGGSAKAGFRIFVGALGVGTQGKFEENDALENRVKFSVPVMFPMQKVNES